VLPRHLLLLPLRLLLPHREPFPALLLKPGSHLELEGDYIGLEHEILLLQVMALEVLMVVEDFQAAAVGEELVLMRMLDCRNRILHCHPQAFEGASQSVEARRSS
jgi:hypothetical protein